MLDGYKKIYIYNRQPQVGDWIESCPVFLNSEAKKGYEYRIVSLRNGYVIVSGDRMPIDKKEIMIMDGQYVIFKKVKLNPINIVKKKFLGITITKKTIYEFDIEK